MSDSSNHRERRSIVVGVTGNIACGKSTVMRCLGEYGAELIDADTVYHELIAPGRPLWKAVRARFGDGVVRDDGSIDRRALGGIVFSDPDALADLDRITHPAVIAAIRDRIVASSSPLLAVDAVKLIESGMAPLCDSVWLVTCDRAQQIERLVSRSGLPRSDAERWVDAQPPLEPKKESAHEVIDNSGSVGRTCEQVTAALSRLSI